MNRWQSEEPREAGDIKPFYREHDEAGEVARGWYYKAHTGFNGPFESAEAAERDIMRLIKEGAFRSAAEEPSEE